MVAETFGAMLRRHRLALGISQNRLARMAGCDPAYVCRLEAGVGDWRGGRPHAPQRGIVLALANVLHLDDGETDRLLYVAGLAPLVDWQARAVAAEAAVEAIRRALDTVDAPLPTTLAAARAS